MMKNGPSLLKFSVVFLFHQTYHTSKFDTQNLGTICSQSSKLSFSRKVPSNYYMEFQHRWSNKISVFVSIHARIQESFVRGGGGGPGPSAKKISDNLFLFFNPQLFYRSPMAYFKENHKFPRVQIDSNIFSRGGGGSNFF